MDKTNPKHYRDAAITLEPIDLCELLGFNLGNAVKYIVRAGHKDGESEVDDIMKAMFYLDREIDRVRKVEAPGGYSEVALWLGQHFALRNGYLDLLFPTIIEQEEDKIKGMIECRKAVAKRYAELTRR